MTPRTSVSFQILTIFLMSFFVACTNGNPTNSTPQNNMDSGGKTTPLYPHKDGWKQTHGGNYLNAPQTCTYCHGEKLDGGSVKVSCHKCHTTYPHTPFWAKPENHGGAFAKILDDIHQVNGDVQVNECVTCHSTSTVKGVVGNPKSAKNMSCNSCHVRVPHDSAGIVSREGETIDHSAFGNEKALQASCLSCHKSLDGGVTRKFMPTLGNCTICHSITDVRPRVKWISDKEAVKVDAFLEELRKNNP